MKKSTAVLLAVASAAVGLVVGVTSGAFAVGVPDVKAPHQCTTAFNLVDKAFVDYENLERAIHLRATRGQSEFADWDAEVARLYGDIDEARADYATAKAACLGDS